MWLQYRTSQTGDCLRDVWGSLSHWLRHWWHFEVLCGPGEMAHSAVPGLRRKDSCCDGGCGDTKVYMKYMDIGMDWMDIMGYIYIYIYTSSTAQGGGGSFKDRKPIGEVGCGESRMAERIHWWTERWLELCFLEWLPWLQWSPHSQLLDVAWCSAIVVVVVV